MFVCCPFMPEAADQSARIIMLFLPNPWLFLSKSSHGKAFSYIYRRFSQKLKRFEKLFLHVRRHQVRRPTSLTDLSSMLSCVVTDFEPAS